MRACLVSESDLTLVCQHILAAGFDPREDERQRKSRRPNCSLLTRHLPAIHPALRRGVFVLRWKARRHLSALAAATPLQSSIASSRSPAQPPVSRSEPVSRSVGAPEESDREYRSGRSQASRRVTRLISFGSFPPGTGGRRDRLWPGSGFGGQVTGFRRRPLHQATRLPRYSQSNRS
jgi:hypothetical protein